MGAEKLARFLSRHGVASRRKTSDIVASGRVRVNGNLELNPLRFIDPAADTVAVDNRIVREAIERHYIALYKPTGYISDLADPRGRPLARQLLDTDAPLFPVGRLDFNSEGLLLFTNDGDFANRIMHPRYGVEKEYIVKLTGTLTSADMQRLLAGIRVDGLMYRVKEITLVRHTAKNTWYRITITEGRNRFIRRVADAVGHPVLKLRRVRIDGIHLGDLKPGQYRHIPIAAIRDAFPDTAPPAEPQRAHRRGKGHFH